MFWMLVLCLLIVSVTAAYRGMNLFNWTLGMALVITAFAVFTSVSTPSIIILAVLFAAVALPLNFKPFRRKNLTAPFLAMYRKMLPTIHRGTSKDCLALFFVAQFYCVNKVPLPTSFHYFAACAAYCLDFGLNR